MFNRPTLAEIVQRIGNDVQSRLGHDDGLRRADTEVYARVLAGAAHGLYGYLDWLSKQILIDTADAEYLERWASIWGIERREAKTAHGEALFIAQSGARIPAYTRLRAIDGTEFETASPIGIASSGPESTQIPVQLRACALGSAGNRAAGECLSLISPILGVQATAVVNGTFTGGADTESDDALRIRLLRRIQHPPQGGAAHDYIAWALEIPGVKQAWCYPEELGSGTVTVRFACDAADPIPNAKQVAIVQAYLEVRRPVTARVIVVAPIPNPILFHIAQLTPDTTTVRKTIEAELRMLLVREATPGGTILLSHIRAALSSASGETDNVLAAPTTDVSNPTGHLGNWGGIRWGNDT